MDDKAITPVIVPPGEATAGDPFSLEVPPKSLLKKALRRCLTLPGGQIRVGLKGRRKPRPGQSKSEMERERQELKGAELVANHLVKMALRARSETARLKATEMIFAASGEPIDAPAGTIAGGGKRIALQVVIEEVGR